ncbi:MAG: hypothetical protein GTO03_18015, partial [Planctomycetales bacterium]|nr:hypothetical protein [Planctomycetales bacterium]
MASIVGAPHTPIYGAGTPLTMLVKSMATSGPAVAVLAVVGSIACLQDRHRSGDQPNLWNQRAWLIPACYLAHLLIHTLIFWRGMYASAGY